MRLPKYWTVFVMIMAASCHGGKSGEDVAYDSSELTPSPYGRWATGKGQVLEINRSGTYKYCDVNYCASGKTEPLPGNDINLLEFFDLPVTQKLLKMADYYPGDLPNDEIGKQQTEPRTVKLERRSDYVFGPNADQSTEKTLCRWRPCTIFGNFETNEFIFVKEAEF